VKAQALRNELQEHAGTELGVGLSFCFVFDCFDDTPTANLVQVEGLDLIHRIANAPRFELLSFLR
jgi:hypothetical protein